MAVTVLPSSMPSRRGGTSASSRACARRSTRLDPACTVGTSCSSAAAAASATKRPKRRGSCRDHDEPATKRGRVAGDAVAVAAEALAAMSLEEKNGVNRLLLSLLPPGCTPDEVNPLPDSVVRVLQKNGTRSCCDDGGVEEIEIDVYTLGDGALRVIKDSVAGYLQDRAQRVEAPSQRQSKAKTIPPRAAPLPPTAPKLSERGKSVRELVKTAISQRLPRNTQETASPSLPAPPEPLKSKKSMKELLEDASRVMKEVTRRREIEKMRAAARLKVEQMVRTVEFNDPYIDPQDVLK